VAQAALTTGKSVYDLVLAKGLLSKETLDNILRPEMLTKPRALATKRE
jgi:aspartate ammonia-lyase